ncbi:MAG: glycosyltransferase, partial [Calditrichota bacterium]
MKQVIINGRFLTQHISGVQRYAREIVCAFDDLLESGDSLLSQFRFELLAPDVELLDPPQLKHIPIRKVGKNSGHRWEQNTLPGYVGKNILFCPGNTAPLRSLFGKSPVVVTVHDLSYLYFPQSYSVSFRAFYRMLIPIILRKADSVITVSKSEESSILKYYPFAKKRLSAIQNGGFGSRFQNLLESNKTLRESDMLLYVGAMNSRKNPQG